MSLGYEWKSVKTVPGSVVRMIPEGVPFNSTKIKVSNVPTSTPILTPMVSSKLGEDIIMRSKLKKLKLKLLKKMIMVNYYIKLLYEIIILNYYIKLLYEIIILNYYMKLSYQIIEVNYYVK